MDSFARSNPSRRGDLAQLKHLAEQARIELSRSDDTILTIEAGYRPMVDDDGREIECDVRLQRSEVEQLLAGAVERTISLARELIGRNPSGKPNAVLMVGGPTQTPFIRERVAAALDLRVDTSASPTTVVAEGAALFAGRAECRQTRVVALLHTRARQCWSSATRASPMTVRWCSD